MRAPLEFGVVGVVALLAVGAVGAGWLVAPVAAAESHVAVRSVAVAPENPQVGETTTVTATVTTFESSPTAARINEVTLRSADGVVAEAEDLGTVGPGGTVEVPLSTSFASPGTKRLAVYVSGQSETGEIFVVRYPVVVSVERSGDVQLSLSTPRDPGTESTVNVTIANGESTNVSNLQLVLSGPDATVEDPRRVTASLGGGDERVVSYDVTFDRPGTHRLTATLAFRNGEGKRRTVSQSRTVTVSEAAVDVELDAEVVRNGSDARIDATLTNFGNVPVEEVRLRGEADGETVARRLVRDIAVESSRTVSIGESSLRAGEVRLVAGYEAGGERYETATTVEFTPTVDGNITLTGVEVFGDGRTVRLAGSASNVGETPVTGAVVEVVDTGAVTPTSPARDYFVGNVPAGEFTSFELTARTASNRTESIPVRITYIADGEQYSRVVRVSLADSAAPVGRTGPDDPDGPRGPNPFSRLGRIDVVGIVLRLAAVVALVGGAVYWWRNRADGEG